MAITFNGVPANAAASAVFVESEAVNRSAGSPVIPHKILLVGQYNSGKSPTVDIAQLILNEADAWTRYGRGSQLAAMYAAAFAATKGQVPIYALPLADDGAGVAATGTIAFTGTATAAGTIYLYVGGKLVKAAAAVGDAATDVGDAVAAAVNADLDLPVTAANVSGTVTFTVRWKGASGNQVNIALNRADTESLPAGISAVITDIGDVVAGANDPDATAGLAALGSTWYTEIAYPYDGDTELDVLEAEGVNRDDPGVNRPFVGLVGYTDTYANFLTALASRNSEWTTFVPVHGSPTPGYVIGAAMAGLFSRIQQATPGRPAKNQVIPGVVAGNDDLTWAEKDAAVKAGGSTTRNLSDGRVVVEDLCTTRTTTDAGADTDDYRFTLIVPNLQFKRYAIEQTFLASPFDQAVVLQDGDPPGPSYGIRPNTVKAFARQLVDDWISRGLSTDRETIVSGITAEIDGSNPGRINLLIPDIASAGLRIVAVKLEWGFVA